MEIADLIDLAGRGEFAAAHVIAGEERFFVERATAALRRAVVGAEGDAFNEEVFQGKGGSAKRILEAARTLPMMAQRRFVLVRGVDQLSDADQEQLAGYLDNPVDTTCLVLTADKLDGRSKLARSAKKLGVLSTAVPLKQSGVRRFIEGEARQRKLQLRADAAAALADALGTDLAAIDDALERLELYVGPGNAIDLAAVEACVSRARVESIWALVDAIGLRDRRTALGAAASLLSAGEPPLRILALIARQLRMVARVRGALQAGMAPQEAARVAGAPPFKAQELAASARRFAPRTLAQAFCVVAETDLALKGSKRPGEVVLQQAVLALTAR